MSTPPTTEDLLGLTARWTASVRARESAREDKLFDDPWAAALAGEAGQAWIQGRSDGNVAPMVIRTRFFDDYLLDVTHQHELRQVVIMAAGLDTRAYRLSWPEGTRLFEIDQPSVLRYKERILRAAGALPRCERQTIEVDLTLPWEDELVRSGFRPQVPTAWLLEGFLFYIASPSITRVLDQVTSLAATGSRLGCDIVNSLVLTSPLTRPWVEMQAQLGAPWIGTLDDPVGFLAARGWTAALSQPGAENANYGRWPFPTIPVTLMTMPHNWYVTAHLGPSTL